MASPLSGAGAYAAMQKLGAAGLGAMPVSKPTIPSSEGGGGFAGMLQQFVGGKADLIEVVTAIAESEAALETLVAVRDKVIGAYEEIMRMPI
jgi:flagellar hook-basal body complex protein FliE